MDGKGIAAEGLIVIGANNKAQEVSFPEFSLNTVSRLELRGQLRPDNIWDMHAKGSTFDGRDLFRDLFNVQNVPKVVPKDKAGLDLIAEIDTVIGFSDTNLKSVRLQLQKRTEGTVEKTTSLDVMAKTDTGKPFEAHIRPAAGGTSKLTAESQDAGQIFKVVGFYPNATGGHMSLEVSLDGRGTVERSGVLKAENFAALGDAVISEVYQSGDGISGNAVQRRKALRERFDFDWMVVPFSVGSGQFVMNNAEIRGPLIGATLRGKVDFKSQHMQVAGTYIPLSGLNSALGGLPLVGQIFGGLKGEGIFGFTFLVHGPIAKPEVLFNPVSGFLPGIFRETQQMAPETFKITPQPASPVPAPPKNPARSSSAAPSTAGSSAAGATPRAQPPGVLSDWSNGSGPPPVKARTKPPADQ